MFKTFVFTRIAQRNTDLQITEKIKLKFLCVFAPSRENRFSGVDKKQDNIHIRRERPYS